MVFMMKRGVLKVRKRRNSSQRPYGKILEAKISRMKRKENQIHSWENYTSKIMNILIE